MFEFIALIQCWRNNSDTDDTFILNLASANQISQEQIEAFKKDPLLFNISGEKGFLIGACEFTKDKDLGEINHLYGLYLAFQGNDTLYILYDNCDYFCCRKCNIQKLFSWSDSLDDFFINSIIVPAKHKKQKGEESELEEDEDN